MIGGPVGPTAGSGCESRGVTMGPSESDLEKISGGRCMYSDTFKSWDGERSVVRCELPYKHAAKWHRAGDHEWRCDALVVWDSGFTERAYRSRVVGSTAYDDDEGAGA